MQPGNLVFVLLAAVWVAYFVLYWSRRRDHLATARTLDRFSSTMRLLQVTGPDLVSAPAPAASRPAGPSPLRATPTARPRTAPRPQVQMRPRRAVRGLTLLTGVLATLVLLPLAAFSVVPWLLVAAGGALALGGLVWLRSGVVAEDRARAARRRTRPSTPAAARTTSGGGSRPVRAAASPPAPVETSAPYDVVTVEQAQAPAPSAADREFAALTAALPARPLVDEDDIPLTWDPVPVPRPTYVMKAKVERPALPEPSATTSLPEGTATVDPAVEDREDDSAYERRVANS